MRLAAPTILLAALALSLAPPTAVPGNVYLEDPDDSEVTTVQLERLDGDGSSLSGTYARVSSYMLVPDGGAIRGVDGAPDFRFEPNTDPMADCTWHADDCSPFDAVNVYYHIDRFAHEFWVGRMGVAIDFQADAVIHTPGDGAYANRPPGSIHFGLGSTMMKNSALDPDIIRHEYTHLVTSSLGFEISIESPVQMRAINEGIAHYFATSYSNDPRIGEWVVTCPPRQHCAGPENDEEMATLATDPAVWNWNRGQPSDQLQYGVCTRFYPLDGKCKIGYHNHTDAYTWGMIWGSALWDLRERIGAIDADRLVLEGLLAAEGADVHFADALRGLAEADARLFGGRHREAVAAVFDARGFQLPAELPVEDGTAHESEIVFELIGASPVHTRAHFAVELARSAAMQAVVYDALGRRVAILHEGRLPPGLHTLIWSTEAAPSGRYFAVLTSNGMRQSIPIFVIR